MRIYNTLNYPILRGVKVGIRKESQAVLQTKTKKQALKANERKDPPRERMQRAGRSLPLNL
jgi:hypothetical protein